MKATLKKPVQIMKSRICHSEACEHVSCILSVVDAWCAVFGREDRLFMVGFRDFL